MKVLALTHAHLKAEGMSPVSCERADSFTGTWATQPSWDVDVVYTAGTQWRGIWPDGQGLKGNILKISAPENLMLRAPRLFSEQLRHLLAQKKITELAKLVAHRILKKFRHSLVSRGLLMPAEFVAARKWAQVIANDKGINTKKYNFIFVCVGYGDEYLLQTALTLSELFKIPMVVDFRDLWSGHHDPARFTQSQRTAIRKMESRLLKTTKLISVPQQPMATHLRTYLSIPVYVAPHSAHIENSWLDGSVTSAEFRMLYAGKIYAGSPGLEMLLQIIAMLPDGSLQKPLRCRFFIDDVAWLQNVAREKGISDRIQVLGWVSPADIWREMRSAHILITFDTNISQTMPVLMTKTFQYALSGRNIMAIYKHSIPAYEEFFAETGSGAIFYDVQQAVAWLKQVSQEETQYRIMPPLRKIRTRNQVAADYAHAITGYL